MFLADRAGMGAAEIEAARGAIEGLLGALEPGVRVVSIEALGVDRPGATAATKAMGYGAPLKITVEAGSSERRAYVLHTEVPGPFGHERRSDRAAHMLLAFDTFGRVPGHVRPIDVGAIEGDGRLRSLRGAGELYLLSEFAEGEVYAEELRRVGQRGRATAADVARAEQLAEVLIAVHSPAEGGEGAYRRAVRDLVGHGEGVFGVIDGYPDAVEAAPRARLEAIERQCSAYRWRLRGKGARLSRVHGDFHPYNIVVRSGASPSLLDASRGSVGDPADDVTCLAINHVFFALEHPGSWRAGFEPLWQAFWGHYMARRHDLELLDVAPPFFAWRALVIGNPRFYPMLSARSRDLLLTLAERWLDAGRLTPDDVDEVIA